MFTFFTLIVLAVAGHVPWWMPVLIVGAGIEWRLEKKLSDWLDNRTVEKKVFGK